MCKQQNVTNFSFVGKVTKREKLTELAAMLRRTTELSIKRGLQHMHYLMRAKLPTLYKLPLTSISIHHKIATFLSPSSGTLILCLFLHDPLPLYAPMKQLWYKRYIKTMSIIIIIIITSGSINSCYIGMLHQPLFTHTPHMCICACHLIADWSTFSLNYYLNFEQHQY